MSFYDIWQVPQLYDILDLDSRSAFNATNRACCALTRSFAAEVTVYDRRHPIWILAATGWSRLTCVRSADPRRLQCSALVDRAYTVKSAAITSTAHDKLHTLDLSDSGLGPAAMLVLVQASLPNIRELGLSTHKLGSLGALYMMKSDWPLLQTLHLSDNDLDAMAVWCLTEADWPELQNLDLQMNKLDVHAARLLSRGPWLGLLSWSPVRLLALHNSSSCHCSLAI